MSKKRDLIQLAILVVLGLGVLAALMLPQISENTNQHPTAEISLFLREGDMALTSNTRLGMEAAALSYGAQLRFVTPPSEETHSQQMTLIQREIDGGADLLILSPIDPTAMGEEDIPLPFITVESEVAGALLCAAPDHSAIGSQLADAILEDGIQGTVLFIDNAGARTGITQRIDQCKADLTAAGRTVTTCSQLALTNGLDLTEIAAIVAPDYQTTLALANWESNQRLHHRIYGVGGTTDIAAYLEQGTLQATVAWSEYAIGYLTIQQAVEAVMGIAQSPFSPPNITTIRGDTIYEPDNQKLLFPVV